MCVCDFWQLRDDFLSSSEPMYRELEQEKDECELVERSLEHEEHKADRKLKHSEEVIEKIHMQDFIHNAQSDMVDKTHGKYHPNKIHVHIPHKPHHNHHHNASHHNHHHNTADIAASPSSYPKSMVTNNKEISSVHRASINRRRSSLLGNVSGRKRVSLFGTKLSLKNTGGSDDDNNSTASSDSSSSGSSSSSSSGSSSSGGDGNNNNDTLSSLTAVTKKIAGIGAYQKRASTHKRRSSVLISDLVISRLMKMTGEGEEK